MTAVDETVHGALIQAPSVALRAQSGRAEPSKGLRRSSGGDRFYCRKPLAARTMVALAATLAHHLQRPRNVSCAHSRPGESNHSVSVVRAAARTVLMKDCIVVSSVSAECTAHSVSPPLDRSCHRSAPPSPEEESPGLSMQRAARSKASDPRANWGESLEPADGVARPRTKRGLSAPVHPPRHAPRPGRGRPRSLGRASGLQPRRDQARPAPEWGSASTAALGRPGRRSEGLQRGARDRRSRGGRPGGLERRGGADQGDVASRRSLHPCVAC